MRLSKWTYYIIKDCYVVKNRYIVNIINETKFILQHLCDKYKNLLPPKEKEYVLSKIDDFAVPLFCILAKVHKNPIVGRPICAGHSWILTPASQVCGTYLQPFLKLFPTILEDTKSFINSIEELTMPKNSILMTIDFDSLYTNIPVSEAIQCVESIFKDNPDFFQKFSSIDSCFIHDQFWALAVFRSITHPGCSIGHIPIM